MAGERAPWRTSTACWPASALYRPFDWPKSPGETILLRNVWKENSASIEVYRAGGGYANLKKHLSMKPDDIVETLKKSSLRGRGRRRLPDRHQVGLPAQRRDAALPLRERGRERARDLQGPADHREGPAPAPRGHHRVRLRDPRHEGLHLRPRRVRGGPAHAAQGAGRGARGRLRGQGHPGHGGRGGHRDPRRRRGLRVRRGVGAAGEPGGQARPAAPAPARSRRCRASTRSRPSSTTSSRSCCVPLVLERGPEWFSVLRRREERRAQALLRERPGAAARHLRGAHGPDHAAPAHRGPGLRRRACARAASSRRWCRAAPPRRC